jgi:hypothetical protein
VPTPIDKKENQGMYFLKFLKYFDTNELQPDVSKLELDENNLAGLMCFSLYCIFLRENNPFLYIYWK